MCIKYVKIKYLQGKIESLCLSKEGIALFKQLHGLPIKFKPFYEKNIRMTDLYCLPFTKNCIQELLY